MKDMVRIVEGVRYDTEKAYLLASDEFGEGEGKRHIYLLRAVQSGRFFQVTTSPWEWEADTLVPLTVDQAIRLYEALPEAEILFEEAFPEVQLVEA